MWAPADGGRACSPKTRPTTSTRERRAGSGSPCGHAIGCTRQVDGARRRTTFIARGGNPAVGRNRNRAYQGARGTDEGVNRGTLRLGSPRIGTGDKKRYRARRRTGKAQAPTA